VANWTNALNLAAARHLHGNPQQIADARNAAEDAKRVFLTRAADELRMS
jgi:hypothetical protein